MILVYSITARYRALQVILLFVLLYLVPGLILANPPDNSIPIQETYDRLKPQLENNIYGIPINIESRDEDNFMQGEIYGRLDFTFPELVAALASPRNWCDIGPLHLNIKACTYQSRKDYCELTFYTGRKYYEAPEDVYQLRYQYKTIEKSPDYFHMQLTADDDHWEPVITKSMLRRFQSLARKPLSVLPTRTNTIP